MSVNLDDLVDGLKKEGKITAKPKLSAQDENSLQEYAIAALNTLRGLSKSDKLKVVNRMRKLLK